MLKVAKTGRRYKRARITFDGSTNDANISELFGAARTTGDRHSY